MRWFLMALIIFVVSSCKKDEMISPTGSYNVTTQVGTQTPKLGTMTIAGKYTITFDQAAGPFEPINATITSGVITIPSQSTYIATYEGSGRVSDQGVLSLDFTVLNHGIKYKVKVQGNRAK